MDFKTCRSDVLKRSYLLLKHSECDPRQCGKPFVMSSSTACNYQQFHVIYFVFSSLIKIACYEVDILCRIVVNDGCYGNIVTPVMSGCLLILFQMRSQLVSAVHDDKTKTILFNLNKSLGAKVNTLINCVMTHLKLSTC